MAADLAAYLPWRISGTGYLEAPAAKVAEDYQHEQDDDDDPK